jgi:hypothetical protein
VYTVPAAHEVMWFKACAPHQSFEVPLTAGLSVRHTSVTEVIAAHPARRWMLMADAGTRLHELGNPPQRWLEVLPAYATLQIEETRRAAEHLAVGVPDLRVGRLPGRFGELRRADLPIDDAARGWLERFEPTFVAWCAELDGAGIGGSIQHDDLHMNNVYERAGALRVLDWGDACVSHPFFSLFETFRFLRELNRLEPGDPWFARLRDAYLEPWGGDRRATFELAERVGGLAHAIAWIRQRDALAPAQRPAFDSAFATIFEIALDAATSASRADARFPSRRV